jgi:non-heme chloroperoxidase
VASRGTKVALATVGVGAGAALALLTAPKVAAARIRRRADDEDHVLEPVVHERIEVATTGGGTISVVRVGEGPPIVLSHGVTLSVRTWVKQLAALPAAGFEAVAYDHRGHGASPAAGSGHAVEHLGDDLRAVLETLDLHDAVLVGHSMGGIAVQSLALDHPSVVAERVRGIVLLSTLPRVAFGSRATRIKQRIERITDRVPDTTWLWQRRDFGLVLARLGFGSDPKPSHVELVRQMMLECPARTRLEAPRALIGIDFVDRLPDVLVPTLVICGTRDLITPDLHSRLLARRIPGARLELVEGGGHMLMLERADEIERLIIDFAHGLPLRAGGGRVEGATRSTA